MTAITFSNQPEIGYGIYTLRDVAQILHLPKATVRRWLKEYWDLRFAKQVGEKHSWGHKRDKAINFFTLVEFYVFYELRKHGVSAKHVLNAHGVLQKELGVDYPFASYRIMTDGKNVLFSPDLDTIVSVKGMQYELKGIIADFLKKIDFDPKNQTALRLYPSGKGHTIVVDPQHQFGQPVIKGTNILTETLYALHLGGESEKQIAALYDIKLSEVRDAIKFYQQAA
ncbi:MAG: DUF433 domain-containing protein [Saprospiraceae bacterium]|nr:DUF433 domain-containing protein [Saprospiraceae bacterium]